MPLSWLRAQADSRAWSAYQAVALGCQSGLVRAGL